MVMPAASYGAAAVATFFQGKSKADKRCDSCLSPTSWTKKLARSAKVSLDSKSVTAILESALSSRINLLHNSQRWRSLHGTGSALFARKWIETDGPFDVAQRSRWSTESGSDSTCGIRGRVGLELVVRWTRFLSKELAMESRGR